LETLPGYLTGLYRLLPRGLLATQPLRAAWPENREEFPLTVLLPLVVHHDGSFIIIRTDTNNAARCNRRPCATADRTEWTLPARLPRALYRLLRWLHRRLLTEGSLGLLTEG